MRVWDIDYKQWRDYPLSRWEVEWRTYDGDPPEDFDPLCDTTCHRKYFPRDQKEEAIDFARGKIDDDFFGSVIVTEESLYIVERDYAAWEYVSQPIYVDEAGVH